MPRYNYMCEKCTIQDYLDSEVDGLSIFVNNDAKDPTKEPLVWEETYGIMDRPCVKCAVCGVECHTTMMGVYTNFIIPGSYLANKVQSKALSNIHKLQYDDPYAGMRESGEQDDKIGQFKKVLKRDAIGKSDKYKHDKTKTKKKPKLDLSKKSKTSIQ